MSKIVFVFGAGASADAGGPLMSNFIDKAEKVYHNPGELEKKAFEIFFEALHCLEQVHTKATLDTNNIETVYGAFEMAVLCGHLEGFDDKRLEDLLPAVRTVISRTIEESISFIDGRGKIIKINAYSFLIQNLRTISDIWTNVDFITYNYDLCLDFILDYYQISFNYCFDSPTVNNGIPLLKLHGSLNWFRDNDNIREIDINVIKLFYKRYQDGNDCKIIIPSMGFFTGKHPMDEYSWKDPIIVPPSWSKGEYHQNVKPIWKIASEHLREAECIFFIGYSLPESDAFFRYLFALGSMGKTRIKCIHVFDPCQNDTVNQRYLSLIGESIRSRYKYDRYDFQSSIVSIMQDIRDVMNL